jgi:hypothetical protein
MARHDLRAPKLCGNQKEVCQVLFYLHKGNKPTDGSGKVVERELAQRSRLKETRILIQLLHSVVFKW